MKYLFFLCAFLCPAIVSVAGDTRNSLESTIPREITKTGRDNFLTLAIENDLFGRGTDQNYTSGIRVTFFDFSSGFPSFAHRLADLIPTFELNRTSSIYYSLGQNLYTPDNIRKRTPDHGDRPWAGFLYVSAAMSTLSGNHIDDLEATAGIVGPWALGEQTQKYVHRHISGSPIPKGWSNQLKNEPGIMLSWQRRWPFFTGREMKGFILSSSPYAGITLGNVYTYANTGITFRFGPSSSRWEDLPLRVRPSMPGTGFFSLRNGKWSWSIFAGLEGRAVARNIFLDGNTFRNGPEVDRLPLVGDANAGLAFTTENARLSYTVIYRTREFAEQDRGDVFGAVSLTFRF